MKLYKCPPRTWVRVVPDEVVRVPPAAPMLDDGERIFFHHIDGMYSLCKKEDGTLCHLVAWQEVEVLDEQPDEPR